MTGRFRLARASLGCLLLAALCATVAWTPAPAAGPAAAASATHRLGLIVAPARIRPGRPAIVRIVDRHGVGGVSARLCARAGTRAATCREVRLKPGQVRLRTHVRLARAGRWTITLQGAAARPTLRRTVRVAATARHRVLVSGDSMVYGMLDVLARTVRRSGGVAQGDVHPGSGITKPALLAWPEHARALARRERSDATVVFLGAVDGFPLERGAGATADCCGPAWVSEYAGRVRRMMAAYLRDGSALVYWLLLPEPRDAPRVAAYDAVNVAIAQAASTFPNGVRVVDIGPAISPGGVYRETAMYRGKLRVIRAPDGLHLDNAGVHLAAAVVERVMRRDGMLR